MKGRLWVQAILLVLEGALVLVFANTASLAGSIVVMVFFSLMVQACEGSTYGIVPYVDPPATGSIAGIVGAGGNTGAVCFQLAFRQLGYKRAFVIMGATIMGSSLLTAFICIKGYGKLLWGKDEDIGAKLAALNVPERTAETEADVNKDDSDEEFKA